MEEDGLEALEVSIGDAGIYADEPPRTIIKDKNSWWRELYIRRDSFLKTIVLVKREGISEELRKKLLKDLGRINFGYFKGKRWQELPEKYIKFLIKKSNISNTNKRKAKETLQYYKDVHKNFGFLLKEYKKYVKEQREEKED